MYISMGREGMSTCERMVSYGSEALRIFVSCWGLGYVKGCVGG